MPFSQKVEMADGSFYTVKKLLAKGESNTKTKKSDKAGMGYLTKSLSMAPAWTSGFNLCTSASDHCINSCLFISGFAMIHPRTILPARIAKSRLLRLHKDIFIKQLERELSSSVKTAKRKGFKLAIRLNTISDVMWEREFPGLMESFPDILFYDYSKHKNRMMRYLGNKLPNNYHLTFSWSGRNKADCLEVLQNGGNVAVPFRVKYRGELRKPLPSHFMGYEVTDGDITDLRFLDPQGGYIVGLRAKGKAKTDTSKFVIDLVDGKAVEV